MGRKPKLDMTTAKIADGKLDGYASVYELVGITNSKYKHNSLGAYSKMLNSMDLLELQEHAYRIGTLAGPDRHSLIERLEKKFIEENRKFGVAVEQFEDPSLNSEFREEAERIVKRGR